MSDILFSAREANSVLPRIIEWRRALHEAPEVGLDLPETIAFATRALSSLGISPREAGRGAFADIGSAGPLVAIRADMDALPLQEETGAPYASRIAGRMHACGHDAHTAMLLGCAALLASSPEPPFRVRLLFQAGEEGCAGALRLIEAGCLDGVLAIVGTHVGDLASGLAPGQAGFLAGPAMAASDRFRAVFTGRGGHASAPHRAVDPISALAHFALAVDALPSRECDPFEPIVVSVTQLLAGTTHNIIPETGACRGTVRTLDETMRARIAVRIREIGEGLAKAHGLSFDLNYEFGYPPVVNDAVATEDAARAAEATLGTDRVVHLTRPSLCGEDFAYYLEKVPGCFWFMNTQNPARGIDAPNHNPRFDVDEALLADPVAVNLNIAAALAKRFG